MWSYPPPPSLPIQPHRDQDRRPRPYGMSAAGQYSRAQAVCRAGRSCGVAEEHSARCGCARRKGAHRNRTCTAAKACTANGMCRGRVCALQRVGRLTLGGQEGVEVVFGLLRREEQHPAHGLRKVAQGATHVRQYVSRAQRCHDCRDCRAPAPALLPLLPTPCPRACIARPAPSTRARARTHFMQPHVFGRHRLGSRRARLRGRPLPTWPGPASGASASRCRRSSRKHRAIMAAPSLPRPPLACEGPRCAARAQRPAWGERGAGMSRQGPLHSGMLERGE